ncbi:MAG: hypothetical protein AAB946_01235 [Patescibacteria group bacterium]
MLKTIHKLREQPESYRHKVAFFTTTVISLAIFVSWAGFKGYIGLPNGQVAYEPEQNMAAILTSKTEAPSPFDNSINAFKAAFSQFGEEYNAIKESLSNVLVPFISGIEVYESK